MERSACTTGPIGSAAMTPQGPYWSARAGERRLPEESELPDGHDRSQRGRREYRNGDRLPVYCSADRRSQGILERKIPRNPVDGGQPGHPSIRLDCGAASLRSTAPQSNYTTTTGHFICYRKRTSSLATDRCQIHLCSKKILKARLANGDGSLDDRCREVCCGRNIYGGSRYFNTACS